MICWLDLVTKVESVLVSALALRLLQAIALGSKQQHFFFLFFPGWKEGRKCLDTAPYFSVVLGSCIPTVRMLAGENGSPVTSDSHFSSVPGLYICF